MRLRILKNIIFLFFLLLIFALICMQIIKGAHYFRLSQNNRIKLIRLAAPRGLIYDRTEKVLAGNRLVFNVALLPQEMRDAQKTMEQIGALLEVPSEQLMREYERNLFVPFVPVVIVPDVPKETAIALESKETDIPGLVIQTKLLRDYPQGEDFCHLLGYLGPASEEELHRFKQYGLRSQDLTGKDGLEKEYDYFLRGESGGMQVEVNNRGYKIKVLGIKQPQKGEDLYLTIDAQLQHLVSGLLKGKKGTCIVMDVHNGEILSMVSAPGFDPNLFIAAVNRKPAAKQGIEQLLDSQEAVLMNRAIQGSYAPGSIFKIIVACAGLQTQQNAALTTVNCTGSTMVGRREFFCWNLDGHGRQNLESAIMQSCNVFFYRLALGLGPENLNLFARTFGLGRQTGIDLPYEASGFVPTAAWKKKKYRERWYDGDTANFAIGQGYLLVTPLQMAQMISTIANGGYLVCPHIGSMVGERKLEIKRKKLDLKADRLEIIKRGMLQVIQASQGTGHKAAIPAVQWAAKTGTAQTSRGIPHGWFGGFYPYEKPRIAVLVFLEYGGSGGEAPALIAKEIIRFIEENRPNFSG